MKTTIEREESMSRKISFIAVTALMLSLYVAPVHAVNPNLIVNGDFEAGNTGFITQYNYLNPANTGSWTLGPEYMYTVSTNPYDYHSFWASFGDHTSGSGKMMIVNGTYLNGETKTVWAQDVTLELTPPTIHEENFPLFAGQDWLVGDVIVTNTIGSVCVKLVLNQETIAAHYLMTEVHIAIGDVLKDIPQSRGNPVPGKFPINLKLIPGQSEYSVCIPFSTDDPIFIAAHAVVARPELSHAAPFCEVSSTTSTDLVNGGDAVVAWGNPNPWDVQMEENLNLGDPDWLWDAQYVTSTVADIGGMVDFVHHFNIPGLPLSAYLKIAADNAFAYHFNAGAEVYENLAPDWRTQAALLNFDWPSVVIDPSPTGWSQVYGYDVLPSIVKGANTLYVTGINADWTTTNPMVNPAAVIYQLCGTYKDIDEVADSETAWGGTTDFPGKNWANHIEYTPADPIINPTKYRFTMFARSTYPDAPAIIKVNVGGTWVGTARLEADTNNWYKFEYDFDVSTSGSATVNLTDFRLIAIGDDFAIDDISLIRLP